MQTFYYKHNKFNRAPHSIRLSKLNYNELTFVLKGELVYHVDGERNVLTAGDCIYIHKGAERMREGSYPADYVSFNFYSPMPFELPTVIKDGVNSEINLLITACDGIYVKYQNWFNIIDNLLKATIGVLFERVASREENPIIVKIKRFVRENLSKKLSLNTIANHVGYSPNYCDTLFKEHTGESILAHLIELRIGEAKMLLTGGALPLKEVALACGFDDYNYFSRLFKQKCGYTPTEYKNKTKNIKL